MCNVLVLGTYLATAMAFPLRGSSHPNLSVRRSAGHGTGSSRVQHSGVKCDQPLPAAFPPPSCVHFLHRSVHSFPRYLRTHQRLRSAGKRIFLSP